MARPDETLQAVLDYYRLQEDDLTGPARLDKDVVEARRIAAYLLYTEHHMRAEAVADRVGYLTRYGVYRVVTDLVNQLHRPSVLSQTDRMLDLGDVITDIQEGQHSPLAESRQRKKRRDRRLAPKSRSKV